MPRIYKCSFCGCEIPPGTGIIYVKNDGTILRFCSSKCRKSAVILKRNPRKVAWARKRRAS
ncbi:MAG: 50S ribosomal protein L24 [Candidatus Verstraetearchaeota archaeon]|nr:50S ribosomal protein L24 [Candidatus Verstraetearchaeota archaeon]